MAGYEAAYNAVPGTYAMQAYDAALLIDSAVKAVKGDLSNKDAVAAALKKADFTFHCAVVSSSTPTAIRSRTFT